MKAELILDARGLLSEGPVWDHRNGILNWVDINKGEFNFFDPATSINKSYPLHQKVGVGIPTNVQDKYILGLQGGLAIFDINKPESLEIMADPESHIPNNRFNDGKCDPKGRLWVGSMDVEVKNNAGNLYLVDQGFIVSKKIDNLTISNGLAWDTEKEIMYFIDTADNCVYTYDFHAEDGHITNKRIAINIPHKHGVPDGMTIDEEGMLWIAHWGGFNVTRWDPENARIIEKVDIPVPQPTSCAFGGVDLDILFITSASIKLPKKDLQDHPESGGLFAVQTGTRGKKTDFFRVK